jgi:hypothetical protein
MTMQFFADESFAKQLDNEGVLQHAVALAVNFHAQRGC